MSVTHDTVWIGRLHILEFKTQMQMLQCMSLWMQD